MRSHRKDLTGKTFGYLNVLEYSHTSDFRKAYWIAECVCGRRKVIQGTHLIAGRIRSCGCRQMELTGVGRRTHGQTCGYKDTPTYTTWLNMIQRCNNPNNPNFDSYGGRGITICQKWRKFENFFADMGERPKGKSLDRINNDGNYEPSNCRWATWIEQATNTSRNRYLEFNGKKLLLRDWAKIIGISRESLRDRLLSGWTIECSLTTPPQKKRNNSQVRQS